MGVRAPSAYINVRVKRSKILWCKFLTHLSHVWTSRPTMVVFIFPSFYASHDPLVYFFVSPVALMFDGRLAQKQT